MRGATGLVIGVLILSMPAPAAERVARLVADLEPAIDAEAAFAPAQVRTVAAFTYFDTGAFRIPELWRTDGTPAGTLRIGRYAPGRGTEAPIDLLGEVSGRLLFRAGGDLHVTDGTVAGTRLVASGIGPTGGGESDGSRVFFSACPGTGQDACELWVSDGRAEGTRRLFGAMWPRGLVGGRLLFSDLGAPGVSPSLHVTDGTVEGTTRLGTFLSPTAGVRSSVVAEGRAYLRLRRSMSETPRIFVTDGTLEGTRPFVPAGREDLDAGDPYGFANGSLFVAVTQAPPQGLWATDGTVAGTFLVTTETVELPGAGTVVSTGRSLFFSAGTALWTSDGSPAGSRKLLDAGAWPSFLTRRGDSDIVFAAGSPGLDRRLFLSDGTPEGTTAPLGASYVVTGNNVRRIATIGPTVVFVGRSPDRGSDLYATDLTVPGTRRVLDAVEPVSSSPNAFAVLGKRLLFSASDRAHGAELFVSDGTSAGTRLVADLAPGPAGSFPFGLVEAGGSVFFGAFPMPHPRGGSTVDLYRTDGTALGTTRVLPSVNLPLSPLRDGLVFTRWLAETLLLSSFSTRTSRVTDLLVIPAGAIGRAYELGGDEMRVVWNVYRSVTSPPETVVTDGTPEGTAVLPFTATGRAVPSPGRLWFPTADGLAVTDGTRAGTRLVEVGVLPEAVLDGLGEWLLFTRRGDSVLHRTDGTVAGTRSLGVRAFGVAGRVNGRLLLTSAGYGGSWESPLAPFGEPYATDGRPEGSASLGDLAAGPISWCNLAADSDICTGASLPSFLTAAGRETYFRGRLGSSEFGLFRTDGTPAGTRRVAAPAFSYVGDVARAGSTLFFAAEEPDHGRELWAVDLPAEGADLLPVTPCRLLDTRTSSPLVPGEVRLIPLDGRCGTSPTARALSLNVTVVPRGSGPVRLQAFAAGAVPSLFGVTSDAGRTRACAMIVATGPGGVAIRNGGDAEIDAVIDVSGSFETEDPS